MTCLVLLPGMDGTGSLFSDFVAARGELIQPVVVAYPPQQVLDYAQLDVYVRERLLWRIGNHDRLDQFAQCSNEIGE